MFPSWYSSNIKSLKEKTTSIKDSLVRRSESLIDRISSKRYFSLEATDRLNRVQEFLEDRGYNNIVFKGFNPTDKAVMSRWIEAQTNNHKVVNVCKAIDDSYVDGRVLVAYSFPMRKDWVKRLISEKLGEEIILEKCGVDESSKDFEEQVERYIKEVWEWYRKNFSNYIPDDEDIIDTVMEFIEEDTGLEPDYESIAKIVRGEEGVGGEDEGDKVEWDDIKKEKESSKQADERKIVKYELDPKFKAPTGLKKPELITYLTSQAKEALTKIYRNAEELRNVKEKQVEIRRELDAAELELKKKRSEMSEELTNYIKMADNAFKKFDLVDNTAYALKTGEDFIFTAIKDVVVKETPDRPPVPRTAEGIITTLVNMGIITEEMVKQAEMKIDELNTDINYVREVVRTLYLFPPTKQERGGKLALSLSDIWSWLKEKFISAKEFLGFATKSVEDFSKEYEELKNILGETYQGE